MRNKRGPQIIGLLLVTGLWQMAAEHSHGNETFEREIAPLLLRRCIECHNARETSGGLNLMQRETAFAGGESGIAVVPGKASESHLLERVIAGEMPPERNGKKVPLSVAEVKVRRDWIDAGAAWPKERTLDPFDQTNSVRGGRDWWSLQPIIRPEVPAMKESGDRANAIDAFISEELTQRKMLSASPADPRTQIRRLYLDLIGLPPSAEVIDEFVADASDAAYERVVDKLLASPQFGERWARHWLDVARFAETNGYERDAVKPFAWKYRDWVIAAINEDKPFDRFVIEQMAGDELPDRDEATVVATGFIRLGTWDDEPNDQQEYIYERLEDMVHATSTAFLGLTVKCARCHDHKFDPILQTDYYRLAATFWPGPIQGGVLGGPTKEQLGFDVLGWTDLGRDAKPLHLLKKGDPHRPEQEVTAGALSFVPVIAREFAAPAEEAKTTRRRLQFAEWLVDPKNPLTARVAVNRLWLHHFGEGIVRSPDNFGFTGQKPTHKKLLDYLASELMAGGWKQKRLHKLLVMSRTYRQASVHPAQDQYLEHDPSNLFWWRANRQRLDAESLRDSILQTSGMLDLRQGGPSFFAPISAEALEGLSMKSGGYPTSPPEETIRRSIYMFTKRGLGVPLMTTFDACDTTMPAGRREVSIVAPQALALLNNGWVQDQSKAFAQRVMRDETGSPERAERAWRLAFGRSPSEEELAEALAHLEAQQKRFAATAGNVEEEAWTSLCHVLLNANEFIYLD